MVAVVEAAVDVARRRFKHAVVRVEIPPLIGNEPALYGGNQVLNLTYVPLRSQFGPLHYLNGADCSGTLPVAGGEGVSCCHRRCFVLLCADLRRKVPQAVSSFAAYRLGIASAIGVLEGHIKFLKVLVQKVRLLRRVLHLNGRVLVL